MELICIWMNHACFTEEFSGGQHDHVTIGRWCHCVERLDQIHIAMAGGILIEQLQDVFIDFGFAMFGQGFIRCHYGTYICTYIHIYTYFYRTNEFVVACVPVHACCAKHASQLRYTVEQRQGYQPYSALFFDMIISKIMTTRQDIHNHLLLMILHILVLLLLCSSWCCRDPVATAAVKGNFSHAEERGTGACG